MTEEERKSDPRPSPNPFVQQVIAAFKQSSPEMRVRDLEQPSKGSLRREDHIVTSNRPCCKQEKAQIVLMCKALRNEDLLPTSSSQVDLNHITSSSLLQRRGNRSLT